MATKIIDPQFLSLVAEGDGPRLACGPEAIYAFQKNAGKMPHRIAGLGRPLLMLHTRVPGSVFAVVTIDHFFDPDLYGDGPPKEGFEGAGVSREAARLAAHTTLHKVERLGLAAIAGVCDGVDVSYRVYVGTPFADEETRKDVAARLCACAGIDEYAFEEALREHLLSAIDEFARPFGERGWVDAELTSLLPTIKTHADSLARRIRATKPAPTAT